MGGGEESVKVLEDRSKDEKTRAPGMRGTSSSKEGFWPQTSESYKLKNAGDTEAKFVKGFASDDFVREYV